MVQQINIKILMFQYNKILLKDCGDSWGLINGVIADQAPLVMAVKEVVQDSVGWQVDNIRLLRINVYEENTDKFEVVFIVDAIKRLDIPQVQLHSNLKWVLLADLPTDIVINKEDLESIEVLQKLVHKGKTIELESLPPVFDLVKSKKTKLVDLLTLPS